jgi:hypothetical protein
MLVVATAAYLAMAVNYTRKILSTLALAGNAIKILRAKFMVTNN